MIQLVIAGLFAVVTIACALTLADCCIRGRFVFERIQRQQKLLDAGFLPLAGAAHSRQRQKIGFEALALGGSFNARLPQNRYTSRTRQSIPQSVRQPEPVHGAA